MAACCSSSATLHIYLTILLVYILSSLFFPSLTVVYCCGDQTRVLHWSFYPVFPFILLFFVHSIQARMTSVGCHDSAEDSTGLQQSPAISYQLLAVLPEQRAVRTEEEMVGVPCWS